jgi:hypothetical protein
MSIAKFNARAAGTGLDKPTVAALQHMSAQTGNEVGAGRCRMWPRRPSRSRPSWTKTEVLELRACLLADAVSASAADVPLVSLTIPKPLTAGAMVSGASSASPATATPGTLNLWLSVGGVKVLTHAFTTPDVIGSDKGFAADFTLTVRA